MTLQERIARALARRINVNYDQIPDRSREHLHLDAQAVIDELGLIEEYEYHTRRHRYTTPWEEA